MERKIDSYELICGLKGCAYIEQDGERFEVTPGRTLLLLPGRVHRGYRPSEGEVSFYWMHFLCPAAKLMDERAANQALRAAAASARSARVVLPTLLTCTEGERLAIWVRQLLHCAASGAYSQVAADYLLTLVLIEASRQAMQAARLLPRPPSDRKLAEMREWIRLNLDEALSVEAVARRFGFNRDYLCRLFKRYTGMPLLRYINEQRMQKARELLSGTRRPVKDISLSLGFGDEKYFMKRFRQSEGLTPSQYRNAFYLAHMNKK